MTRPDIKEKISKKAYKCYNRYRGNCSATYKTANEVCLYCLEFIIKIPRHKNLQINSGSKEIEIPKYMRKKSKFPIVLIDFPIKNLLNYKKRKINN